VAVVGSGGAGKSTFARALGGVTGLPVVHLDEHYWRPGWVEPSKTEWSAIQTDLVSRDRWIMDGNYGGTFDVRFARADTVIVLSLPRAACLVGSTRRFSNGSGGTRPTVGRDWMPLSNRTPAGSRSSRSTPGAKPPNCWRD